jgi:hypothetical protein
MRHFFRPIDRRCLDAATAEGLLAGRGVPEDSPPGQQALARLLEIAAGPPGDEELSGVAVAVAGFVATRHETRRRSRRRARLTLAGAAGAVALVGSAAFADALPARLQEVVHVTFGAPAPRHDVTRTSLGPAGHHPASGPGYQQESVPWGRLGHGQTTAPATSPRTRLKPTATPTPTPPKPWPVPRPPALTEGLAPAQSPATTTGTLPKPAPAATGTG